MIRDPFGDHNDKQYWNQKWSYQDHENWTPEYLAPVPYNVNPFESIKDGIFFVEDEDFPECFSMMTDTHYRDHEGFSNNWHDVEKDNGKQKEFYFTMPKHDGPFYLSSETYAPDMVPEGPFCLNYDYPTHNYKIFKWN